MDIPRDDVEESTNNFLKTCVYDLVWAFHKFKCNETADEKKKVTNEKGQRSTRNSVIPYLTSQALPRTFISAWHISRQ